MIYSVHARGTELTVPKEEYCSKPSGNCHNAFDNKDPPPAFSVQPVPNSDQGEKICELRPVSYYATSRVYKMDLRLVQTPKWWERPCRRTKPCYRFRIACTKIQWWIQHQGTLLTISGWPDTSVRRCYRYTSSFEDTKKGSQCGHSLPWSHESQA